MRTPQRSAHLSRRTDERIRRRLEMIALQAKKDLEQAGLPLTPQLISLQEWLRGTDNRSSQDSKKEGEGAK